MEFSGENVAIQNGGEISNKMINFLIISCFKLSIQTEKALNSLGQSTKYYLRYGDKECCKWHLDKVNKMLTAYIDC